MSGRTVSRSADFQAIQPNHSSSIFGSGYESGGAPCLWRPLGRTATPPDQPRPSRQACRVCLACRHRVTPAVTGSRYRGCRIGRGRPGGRGRRERHAERRFSDISQLPYLKENPILTSYSHFRERQV